MDEINSFKQKKRRSHGQTQELMNLIKVAKSQSQRIKKSLMKTGKDKDTAK